MKAILMAAGIGSRLSRVVNKPKSILDIDGIPLIRRTVSLLQNAGIEVAVVVGYKKELISNALDGLNVTLFHNPFYRVTNSMGSLWLAKEFISPNEPLILGNADVFWTEDILDLLTNDQRDAVMLSDKTRVDVGDFFFQTDSNNAIVAYGKTLERHERDCEYVGLAKLSASFVNGFIQRLEKCVENEEYTLWWENVLYHHNSEFPIYALDVDGRFWGEIDYIEDYERIVNHIKTQRRCKK